MFFIDPLWIFLAIPGLILALIAQALVWFAYNQYSKVNAGSGITGLQAAELINQKEGFNVKLITSPGKLNDYFNPRTNTVNVSADNATNGSVANIAVVAHEFGHVQQKANAILLFRIRTFMVPAVGFGSNLGYIFILIGLAIAATDLAWVGVALFSLTTIFTFLTVPIEIDASRRGLAIIKKHRLINYEKMGGARLVLAAAALTYIAALVQSLGQLLYFVMLVGGSRD